jgi:hypothetical protein
MLIIIWLVVGAVFFALDRWKNGIGLNYASYSGFTLAVFLTIGVMHNSEELPYIIGHIIFFFAATAMWWVILRDKEKKGKHGQGKDFEQKIIGQVAQAGSDGINAISGGEIIWSGQTFKARLAKNLSVEIIEAGSPVLVKEVVGDTIIVAPKS